MGPDPDPIEPGTTGTVVGVVAFGEGYQISMRWDNGRSLFLCWPEDQFYVVQRAATVTVICCGSVVPVGHSCTQCGSIAKGTP